LNHFLHGGRVNREVIKMNSKELFTEAESPSMEESNLTTTKMSSWKPGDLLGFDIKEQKKLSLSLVLFS